MQHHLAQRNTIQHIPCLNGEEYMNWSSSYETLHEQLNSPSENNRKRMSLCKENLYVFNTEHVSNVCFYSMHRAVTAEPLW